MARTIILAGGCAWLRSPIKVPDTFFFSQKAGVLLDENSTLDFTMHAVAVLAAIWEAAAIVLDIRKE